MTTDTPTADSIETCPKCGEPHSAETIGIAELLGASKALCRKCTAIEKRERFGFAEDQ